MWQRRPLVLAGLASLAGLTSAPALASSRRSLAAMTEGPFYPPRAWREQWPDWDADLTRVQGRDGRVRQAQGDLLGLEARVVDSDGRLIDGAQVEIWQCDRLAQYRHPSVAQRPGEFDEGFQGYGAARSDARGSDARAGR